YRPPQPPRERYIRGQLVGDLIRGEVEYRGLSDAPISWPVGRAVARGRPTPIVTVELARAIRTESVEAIVWHWGASRCTACRWRKALGVPRFNAGTQARWRELAPLKLPAGGRKKAVAS